jgi:hypothetical protein
VIGPGERKPFVAQQSSPFFRVLAGLPLRNYAVQVAVVRCHLGLRELTFVDEYGG